VGLSPAIAAIWRVSQLPHGRGSVNAGVSDGGLSATVLADGVTTYKGSISLLAVALLLALPPLVMWAVFLFSSRTIDAGERDFVEQSDITALNAGDAEIFRASSSTSKRRSREGS
jgi:hypothetical protein